MGSFKTFRETLLRHFRRWKLLSIRKLLYFPRILTIAEKKFFILLIAIIVISGISLFIRIYRAVTLPVAAIGSNYREGVLSEPRTINPIYASLNADRDLERLIFSRLITYSGNGTLEFDMAENYTVSPDGKIYTVVLKKNIIWHDGIKLTADDVVFTVKTIQDPKYKSPFRANWQGVSVDKIDQFTVRFSLKGPYAPFIENLSVGILPKHLWETISPEQALTHELNLKPIGSGPYRFGRMVKEKDGTITSFEVARNTKYYREGPYLNTITLVFFKTEDDMIAAWRKNEIEGFGPLSSEHKKEFFEDRVVIADPIMPRLFGVFFNQKHAPVLNDKNIREAIARAIDKKRIAQSASLGAAMSIDSSLPPASPGYTMNVALYPFNPDESRLLLEKSGWKDTDNDGIVEIKKRDRGKDVLIPLRLTLATSDWPDLVNTAELIKQFLRDIGIDVTIEARPFSELESEIIRPRNFDMLLFGQVYGYEPDPFAFWHSSQTKDPGLNVALYSNKKIDTLLETARKTTDKTIRNANYESMQKIIATELPAIFLYSQQYLYLLPQNIRGVELFKISLPADRFNEINRWHRTTRRVFK